MPLEDVWLLVRSLTAWFQLMNLAEDNERMRRIRARHAEGAPAPRRGSLADAVRRLVERGTEADDLERMLGRAELRPVMTANPTEARRGTIVKKIARAFAILRALDECVPAPG